MQLSVKESIYTYADYLAWEGEERYELIDGKSKAAVNVLPGCVVDLAWVFGLSHNLQEE
ncbi:MAG: hypothetical protein IJ849_02155 [Selenomonadaceae bacterium]|nr:hypothetical protein [Selenomonadaceae bacterium]